MARVRKQIPEGRIAPIARYDNDMDFFQPVEAMLYTTGIGMVEPDSAGWSVELKGPVLTKTMKRHRTQEFSREYGTARHCSNRELPDGSDPLSLFSADEIKEFIGLIVTDLQRFSSSCVAVVEMLTEAFVALPSETPRWWFTGPGAPPHPWELSALKVGRVDTVWQRCGPPSPAPCAHRRVRWRGESPSRFPRHHPSFHLPQHGGYMSQPTLHTITLTDEQWTDLRAVFAGELEVARPHFQEEVEKGRYLGNPEVVVVQRQQEQRIDALHALLFGGGHG